MKRLLATLVALFALAAPPAHAAFGLHGTSGACPYGTCASDGYNARVANGAFLATSYYGLTLDQLFDTSQWTGSHPFSFSLAGFDYAIAYSIGTLHDPADVAVFTGSVANGGTTLTIGTLTSGTIKVGQTIDEQTNFAAIGLPANTKILANISGSGNGSTWTLSHAATSTITSLAMLSQWSPSGCRYNATESFTFTSGTYTIPATVCDKYANAYVVSPDLTSLDFSGTVVGTNNCVEVYMSSGVTGQPVIENSFMQSSPGGACDKKGGSLYVSGNGAAGLTLLNDLVDENYVKGSSQLMLASILTGAGGDVILDHTAIIRSSQRPVAMGNPISGHVIKLISSFIRDYVGGSIPTVATNNGTEHGEWDELPTGSNYNPSLYDVEYSLLDTGFAPGGSVSSDIYVNGGTGRTIVLAQLTLKNNVILTKCAVNDCSTAATGMTLSLTGTGGDTFATAQSFSVSGGSGTIEAGQELFMTPAAGAACPGTTSVYSCVGLVQTFTGNASSGSGTISGIAAQGALSSSSGGSHTINLTSSSPIAATAITVTNANITGNYLYAKGAYYCLTNTPSGPASYTNTPTMSGNVNLVSGNSILNSMSDAEKSPSQSGCM